MYICICKAVRRTDIKGFLSSQGGAGKVRLRDLREHLGVCSECGKCGEMALSLLRDGVCADSRASVVAT